MGETSSVPKEVPAQEKSDPDLPESTPSTQRGAGGNSTGGNSDYEKNLNIEAHQNERRGDIKYHRSILAYVAGDIIIKDEDTVTGSIDDCDA